MIKKFRMVGILDTQSSATAQCKFVFDQAIVAWNVKTVAVY